MTGIYKIQSKSKPERCYIGSAVNLSNRWSVHQKDLRKNSHASMKLQRHYNKYGFADLDFSIIENCSKNSLIEREQFYIDNLDPFFNISKVAGSPMLNRKHSEKTRKQMSKSHIGLQTWCVGKSLSEEHKKKLSIASSKALKGRKHSEEHNRNNGLARRIPILQFNKEGELIREWDSATSASKELRLDKANINSCCRNKYGHKTVGGFVWKYKIN